MTTVETALPSTHRALVLRDVNQDPKVEEVTSPQVTPGAAVLRVLLTPILSYMKDIVIGNTRKYNFPLPIVPGVSAIGRIVALGQDATSLEIGQLVLFDCFIGARDAQNGPEQFLSAISGGFSAASERLMAEGGFRDGSYAEYMRVPLENLFLLDEARLLGSPSSGGLGLQLEDLCQFTLLAVPHGGFSSVGLKPGETVLISPATGPFGGGAVRIALSMGAKVLAWGRNEEKLKALKATFDGIDSGRFKDMLEIVKLHNDPDKDAEAIKVAAGGSTIDVFFDISPNEALESTHLKTGIQSLRHGGRVSLMGGQRGDVSIPHFFVMRRDITLKGKWMYTRDDLLHLVKMVQAGVVKIGKAGGRKVTGVFGLDDWKQALDHAAAEAGLGKQVLFKP